MANRTVSVVLQAEIGQYVAGMTKAAAATKGVGDSAATTSGQASKGFDLAGRGAQLFGLAAVGALAGIVSKSIAFEKSMSAVQAATQASAATMGELRAAAIKAGADTQYSATEAADAITEMAKAGVSTADIMKGGLRGALALAAAGQLDVADAAGIASTAMTQFGLSGAQLPHVADLLAAGAGKAMGSVKDMGQALNQAGLLAASTGISIEETTGSLAAFASAGLIGSDAGTSFKTMLQALQNPSKESAALMKELGINAYDAQGNFVGMAALAEQLRTRLGTLTQAQRDQALAQIFGTDAARAATVLYREGAAGIQEWTAKVDDAGYAQRQAAELTDNLAGDLERLGGSLDTLLISIGSGVQGPLRGLVQMLGGLVDGAAFVVDAFGEMPGPVQAGVIALAAIAALKSPVTSAFETIALKAMYATSAFSGVSFSMGGLKAAGAGLMGFFGGPWGLAITGATVGLSLLVDWLGQSDKATEATKQATQGYADALRNANGAINESVRSAAAKAAQDTGLLDVASRLGVSLSTVTDAITGEGDALDATRAALQSTIEAHTTHAGVVGADANATVTSGVALDAQGRAAKNALDSLNSLSGQTQTGIADAQQLAAATDTAGTSMTGGALSADQLSAQLDDVAAAADDAKKQTDQFKLSLDVLTGRQISLNEVEAAYYAALDAATGALEGLNGRVIDGAGALDLSTAAGRKTNDILTDLRNTSNQYISTLIQQGATTDQVQAKDAQLRQSFWNTALQMTGSRQAADNLTNAIYGIPSERTTQINADTTAARNNIAATQSQIDGLHGKTIVVTVTANGTVAAILGSANQVAQPGVIVGYAEGGYTGPGGKHKPAGVVHAGEVVWSQDDVSAWGGPQRVDSMRKRRSGRAPGYADGGIVIDIDDRPLATVVGGVKKGMEPVVGYTAALQFAMAQSGKPYIWGGVGPGGYDCSGFMSAITNVIRGRNPYSRVGSTASFPWAGFAAGNGMFTIGSTANAGGGIGHMAGTLLGVNVESTGDHVRYGATARGASNGLFTTRAHLAMANGGIIGEPVFGVGMHSGNTYSFAERGPELVVPHGREQSGGSGSWSGGGRAPVNVTVNARVFVGSREITDIARVEAETVVGSVITGAADGVTYSRSRGGR